MADLTFRKALAAEADQIASPINLCYRGEANGYSLSEEPDVANPPQSRCPLRVTSRMNARGIAFLGFVEWPPRPGIA
jgi:hypothetical protein